MAEINSTKVKEFWLMFWDEYLTQIYKYINLLSSGISVYQDPNLINILDLMRKLKVEEETFKCFVFLPAQNLVKRLRLKMR